MVTLAALLALPGLAAAQTSWQFSPYEVRVWVATTPRAGSKDRWTAALAQVLPGQSEANFGATWNLETLSAPDSLRTELVLRDAPPAAERLEAAGDLKTADKLFTVAIDFDEGEYQIKVRELDVRTRIWSSPQERAAAQPEAASLLAWDAIRAAFTPLAKVEKVDGKQVAARVRAGGLIVESGSPVQIPPGSALQPVIRRNDRTGQPLKGGLQAVPWAVLDVTANEEALLTCTLYSGLRYAIPSRGGPRTERLALLMRRQTEATTLHLQTRGNNSRPLPGYEVFAKLPNSDEDAQLVGLTDGAGNLTLPQSDPPLRVLYIRNGGQLLARLPLVAGVEPLVSAKVPDDELRLQAEGIVLALQSRVMDLTARREILAARIRARIKAGQLAEAGQLIEELRLMETRADLVKELDAQRQQVRSSERLTQARIDKLLSNGRGLLTKFLDPRLPEVLTAELEKARAGTPTAAPANPPGA
jgi:hypothetical protein